MGQSELKKMDASDKTNVFLMIGQKFGEVTKV